MRLVLTINQSYAILPNIKATSKYLLRENDMLDRLQEFLTDLENNEDTLEGLDLFDD
tara:strand:+ start:1320 stop:1490 length:171 start_codon:yes stop_codon:yes gene_type:complete